MGRELHADSWDSHYTPGAAKNHSANYTAGAAKNHSAWKRCSQPGPSVPFAEWARDDGKRLGETGEKKGRVAGLSASRIEERSTAALKKVKEIEAKTRAYGKVKAKELKGKSDYMNCQLKEEQRVTHKCYDLIKKAKPGNKYDFEIMNFILDSEAAARNRIVPSAAPTARPTQKPTRKPTGGPNAKKAHRRRTGHGEEEDLGEADEDEESISPVKLAEKRRAYSQARDSLKLAEMKYMAASDKVKQLKKTQLNNKIRNKKADNTLPGKISAALVDTRKARQARDMASGKVKMLKRAAEYALKQARETENGANVFDHPFVGDFVHAHKRCVKTQANFRRFECGRMFGFKNSEAPVGPGQGCIPKTVTGCAERGDCNRVFDVDASRQYRSMHWRTNADNFENWNNFKALGYKNDRSGKASFDSSCSRLGADLGIYDKGAEEEGYVSGYKGQTSFSPKYPRYLRPNLYGDDLAKEDIPAKLVGWNPGGRKSTNPTGLQRVTEYSDTSLGFLETVQRAETKKRSMQDNINKAENGVITEKLWRPWTADRDDRGVRASKATHKHTVRHVTMLEAVAIPRGDGTFIRQLWLATGAPDITHPKKQGMTDAEAAPTWASSKGAEVCPPYGVETKLYVAEVPDFSVCTSRCEIHFRDAGFTATPAMPTPRDLIHRRNPDVIKYLEKATQRAREYRGEEAVLIDASRTNDANGTKCTNGPGRSNAKTNIVSMAFDTVSKDEKHLYLLDACGRVISSVIRGGAKMETMTQQQELAGAKCRERAVNGGASYDGLGTNAAFSPFGGREFSGAGMSVITDRTTLNKYLVVAEGWKSKLRTITLGKMTNGSSLESITEPFKYPWRSPRPAENKAIVDTLGNLVGARKISAGEDENMYGVSSQGVVLSFDMRPKLTCDMVRKVFPRTMQSRPVSNWKHHFGFDKWLPDRKDNSTTLCESTDECKGMTEQFNPVCRCPGGMQTSEEVCDRPNEYESCIAKGCKRLGCLPTGLKGDAKTQWAEAWWQQLSNPKKITFQSGWEHFPIQRLTKTMKFCLHTRTDKKLADVVQLQDSRNTTEEVLKANLAKPSAEEVVVSTNNECGVKHGSWWKVKLMKTVQMIRHMCGPDNTPAAYCPVAYLIKDASCSEEMIGYHTGKRVNYTDHAELRKALPPVCCVDKMMQSYITPRLGDVTMDLPGDLQAQAMEKLEQFYRG